MQTGDEVPPSGSEKEGSDEEEDPDEDSFQLKLASDSESDDEMDAESVEDSDGAGEQREPDDEPSDEDMDTLEDQKDFGEDEAEEKMPFRGPLALKTHKKQGPSSLLDGVDTDTDDGASESGAVREERMDAAEGDSDSDENESEEEVPIELDEEEKALTKEWELFGMDVRILKALAALKYEEPTEIQSQCLTPAIRDRYV